MFITKSLRMFQATILKKQINMNKNKDYQRDKLCHKSTEGTRIKTNQKLILVKTFLPVFSQYTAKGS